MNATNTKNADLDSLSTREAETKTQTKKRPYQRPAILSAGGGEAVTLGTGGTLGFMVCH
jgi:hypothetical protein